MSSLANALKRKTHKERGQPAKRRKYGLLEKHKDYVLRARDFHKKEKTIKTLQRKAEEKNPDEFYFAMEKAQTKEGVHNVSTAEANKYSHEELQLMKTQDVKYMTLKLQQEQKKIEKLKQRLHFIGLPKRAKHVVFVDEEEEAVQFKPEEYFDTDPDLLDRAFNRPKLSQLDSASTAGPASAPPQPSSISKANKRKFAGYNELSQRLKRVSKLRRVADKLGMDKVLMGKGRKKKGKDGTWKWKQERKK